jgi:site-specific DNA-methyltransferase (adenine-specific)
MHTNKNITAGDNFTLHLGDNLVTLKAYPDNTFDSIVTDPPYFIDFLGKEWDSSKSDFTPLFKECLRVLKPGGYLLAFGAPRTFHKTVTMIENAGFEIRDQINWIFSSGFPKAQSVGLALKKRGDYYTLSETPLEVLTEIEECLNNV